MLRTKSLPQLFIKMASGTADIVACIIFIRMLNTFTRNLAGAKHSNSNANSVGNQISIGFIYRFYVKTMVLCSRSFQKNRVVKFLTLVEIFLDLIPTYGTFVFNLIVGSPLSTYAGDTITISVSLVAFISACIYWRSFRTRNGNRIKQINIAVTRVDPSKAMHIIK